MAKGVGSQETIFNSRLVVEFSQIIREDPEDPDRDNAFTSDNDGNQVTELVTRWRGDHGREDPGAQMRKHSLSTKSADEKENTEMYYALLGLN